MQQINDITNIPELTDLAFQYGPFLFALLFNLVITFRAKHAYDRACQRTNPRASKEEKRTYRIYFLGTALFGILLVIASITWWFAKQPSMRVFTGTIELLQDYERITSSTLYFRTEGIEKIDKKISLRNEHFVYIQNKPFLKEQEFAILFCKGGLREVRDEFQPKYETFYIPYTETPVSYRIVFDERQGKNVLKRSFPSYPETSKFFLRRVYAGETKKSTKESIEKAENYNPGYFIDKRIISYLQDENSDVGVKIAALNNLLSASDDALRGYLETKTKKEPMIVTLLDLSRHSDRELAYKANEIITQRFDLTIYIINGLETKAMSQKDIEDVLVRMEKPKAEEILLNIYEITQLQWVNALYENIRSGSKRCIVLKPTGSLRGDRYYIRFNWDASQPRVVKCLADLFYEELKHEMYKATAEEELDLLKASGNRVVTANSKDHALRLVSKAEECNVIVSFPMMVISPPHGLDEILREFGDIYSYFSTDGQLDEERWRKDQMASFKLPAPIPLAWEKTKTTTRLVCHKKLLAVFKDVFDEIYASGLWDKIEDFGGLYGYRKPRNMQRISLHAWGAAIDINVLSNRPRRPSKMDHRIVQIFRNHGFTWGGDRPERYSDPQHFQFATGY